MKNITMSLLYSLLLMATTTHAMKITKLPDELTAEPKTTIPAMIAAYQSPSLLHSASVDSQTAHNQSMTKKGDVADALITRIPSTSQLLHLRVSTIDGGYSTFQELPHGGDITRTYDAHNKLISQVKTFVRVSNNGRLESTTIHG